MVLIIKHVPIEGPGIISDFFLSRGIFPKVIDLSLGESLPQDLEKFKAVIILGGPMNVYQEDKYPFLKQEDVFIKKVVDLKVPLLGICLGAQLIAKALGSKVKKAQREEAGWLGVTLTEAGKKDLLFSGLEDELVVFQWHEDEFRIPKQAILLAQSDVCSQAYKLGANCYGLQFHFEVTPFMVEAWIKEYKAGDKEKQMLLEFGQKEPNFSLLGQRILAGFLKNIKA